MALQFNLFLRSGHHEDFLKILIENEVFSLENLHVGGMSTCLSIYLSLQYIAKFGVGPPQHLGRKKGKRKKGRKKENSSQKITENIKRITE